MRVVMAEDRLTDHILGVIPKDMTPEDEVALWLKSPSSAGSPVPFLKLIDLRPGRAAHTEPCCGKRHEARGTLFWRNKCSHTGMLQGL